MSAEVRLQDLDRYLAVVSLVSSAVDFTHRARPDQRFDLVMANGSSHQLSGAFQRPNFHPQSGLIFRLSESIFRRFIERVPTLRHQPRLRRDSREIAPVKCRREVRGARDIISECTGELAPGGRNPRTPGYTIRNCRPPISF